MTSGTASQNSAFSEVAKAFVEYINAYIRIIKEIVELERRYGVPIYEIPRWVEEYVGGILRSGDVREVAKVLNLFQLLSKYRNELNADPLTMNFEGREKLVKNLTRLADEISRLASSGEG